MLASFLWSAKGVSTGVSEAELIQIAVKTLGLDELAPFDPKSRVIEYLLEDASQKPLVNKTLIAFADETASDSPAPGGGSISAYVGTLGISLATMVASLSANKQGWDDQLDYFSDIAVKGQKLKDQLLNMVDEDTHAFNKIMDAFKLPKSTDEEKQARKNAIGDATRTAIEVPLKVMELSLSSMDIIQQMAERGNPNSASDAGVGALCARTAVEGAYLNVLINCNGFDDKEFVSVSMAKADKMLHEAKERERVIVEKVRAVIGS
jgi:glutamate formiminotransferase/formiminotetrahydrofolate cyclodeaminase